MKATISISHKGLTALAVNEIAASVAELGGLGLIRGAKITNNLSIVDGKVERGLDVTLFEPISPSVVIALFDYWRDEYDLTCAFLVIEDDEFINDYVGCIKKWDLWKDYEHEGEDFTSTWEEQF